MARLHTVLGKGVTAPSRPVVRLSRGGFTLIELLVVISIIAILISLLLPAMRQARVQARSVTCLSNEHQLVLGCLMYYQDTGYLPTSWSEPGYPTAPVHKPFFGVEAWSRSAPARVELGLVWPYYQNEDAAFCPDWELNPELVQAGVIWPGTQKGLSYGFNNLFLGRFDSPYSGYVGYIPGSMPPASPDYFNEPSNTLWFMDSASGYPGNYILPPMWPEIYNFWPGLPPGAEWWETVRPSQRHMGSFNSTFLDGHVEHTPFELYYDVGPASPSARYWGSWDN